MSIFKGKFKQNKGMGMIEIIIIILILLAVAIIFRREITSIVESVLQEVKNDLLGF